MAPLIEFDDVIAALDEDEPIEFPDSVDGYRGPEQWRPIISSGDRRDRRNHALALWNSDLVERLPRFFAALQEHLQDVRVCVLRGEYVLVYIAEGNDEPCVVWIGWSPDSLLGAAPTLWDCVPLPLRTFLHDVHAGFTAADWESYGPMSPANMTTPAQEFGSPTGIPGWEQDIDSTRLLLVTKTYSNLRYYLSPDIAEGEVVLCYEGDCDIEDLWTQLDDLMVDRIE